MPVTCTPYQGKLSRDQQRKLIEFLWDQLPTVKGKDQRRTGYGTKTQTGLLATLETIILGQSVDDPANSLDVGSGG
jgi:hypothetical protein